MLLTISTTHAPATDLGYLLHKNPARPQSFKLSFGEAHVFYPEASPERCTVALLLDVDPVGLVRGRSRTLGQYVNDRSYVTTSFLSVAIAGVFKTALSGRSKERPELADKSEQEAVPWWEDIMGESRGGEGMVVKLLDFVAKGWRGIVKCRGQEYLRLIYGPEYTAPANLERIRSRGLGAKCSLALREFALGIEATAASTSACSSNCTSPATLPTSPRLRPRKTL